MPRKLKKTRAENIAENYFPIDADDLKYSIEKRVKEDTSLSKTKTEKSYKEAKEEKEIYEIPKINLKEEGYELIITEKPQAALKIASALGDAEKRDFKKIPYYEIDKNGKRILVACAVGHLFTLKQERAKKKLPIFNIKWVPNYLARKKDFTKKYYDALLKLAKSAGSLTVATDYDIEGEVIGYNIIRFICGQEDANRMKFSTLTAKELEEAYQKKSKTINWGQAIAGETRHYLDWFYGINLSRALMNAIKTTGKFRIMSIGRVQGPTLNLLVKKEREIQKFKPETYWQIFIEINDRTNSLELKHNKDLFDKKELKKFDKLKGKKIKVKTEKKEQFLPPNPPFNLTTLQTEAYKFHGITPSNTLKAAQSLYLSGLISYPRTSSQKLPESVNYKEILNKLAKKYQIEKLITRNTPIQGKKSDPAHPSIYPTGNYQILSGDEHKIYELIVKRFLALFCDSAIIDSKTIKTEVNKLVFSARGSSVRKKAWMEIYPSKLKENEIPDIKENAEIIKCRNEEKQTQPPKRYSPASIISELEKKNLGTKATRSMILETLYDRNYIKEKSIEVTPLGMSLISTLEKFSPIIIDEELTRRFETEIESIQKAKGNHKEREKKIIEKAKKTITSISKDFEENEEKIGKELLKANLEHFEKEKQENKLNICPVCKKGNLGITYSRKTKRFFIACDDYPNCKNTYSLPPNGSFKKTDKICEKCDFPLLMSLRKGKKPWIFCFNPECPTNKERIESYKKKYHN